VDISYLYKFVYANTSRLVITHPQKGFYRFSLQAANYQTVLTSMNYATLANCREGVETISLTHRWMKALWRTDAYNDSEIAQILEGRRDCVFLTRPLHYPWIL